MLNRLFVSKSIFKCELDRVAHTIPKRLRRVLRIDYLYGTMISLNELLRFLSRNLQLLGDLLNRPLLLNRALKRGGTARHESVESRVAEMVCVVGIAVREDFCGEQLESIHSIHDLNPS